MAEGKTQGTTAATKSDSKGSQSHPFLLSMAAGLADFGSSRETSLVPHSILGISGRSLDAHGSLLTGWGVEGWGKRRVVVVHEF